jgi:hypothetical protein
MGKSASRDRHGCRTSQPTAESAQRDAAAFTTLNQFIHCIRLVALDEIFEFREIECNDLGENIHVTTPVVNTTNERLPREAAGESAGPSWSDAEQETADMEAEPFWPLQADCRTGQSRERTQQPCADGRLRYGLLEISGDPACQLLLGSSPRKRS